MLKGSGNYLSKVFKTLVISFWIQWIALVVCTSITIYAFQTARSEMNSRNISIFEDLAQHHIEAFQVRMQNYSHSLDGGAGLLASFDSVNLSEWQSYTKKLDIKNKLPGMLGVGYIEVVNRQQEAKFLKDVRANGLDDFQIHPETGADEKFIIKFIEPLEDNIEAVGLDIGFEKNRRLAANLARDSGLPIMTQHIQLVQDKSIKLGFLLLHPYYATDMPLDTVLQRRAAAKGWVYTPFVGHKVFEKLAVDQQDKFYVSVYDGNENDPGSLIYDNHGDQQSEGVSKYIVKSNFELFGRTWTFIWRSSSEFEALHTSNGPILILFIGILLSAIFVSIISTLAHRTNKARHFADKKAHELAVSEERWNLALKGAEIGVFDIDLVRESSIVSDTWKDLMNVPLNDPSIDTQGVFLKRIHPDDLLLVQAADKACFEGKTDRSVAEYRIQTSPGVWRWMKSDAAVVERSKEGKALRFVGSQTDVTSLHEARAALQASRGQFEALFSRAPVGMALIDEKAAFTTANNAFCSFLGYSETDLISKKYWNFMLPNESRKIADIIKAIRNGDQVTHQSEYQFVGKDGQIKWGLANVSLDRDPMTGRDLYIVQIQDINKIKEIEKIKSEFIAMVSHELRTPLTSIKGAVELILGTESGQLSDTAVRLLDIANSNCGRLTLLVNDILDMERISSGNLEINFTGENLKMLIQNSIKNITPYLMEYKTSIVCKLPQDDLIVWVDGKRVEQILTNLLSNAAKFSFPGGEIQVSFKLEDQLVKVTVCDFGIGISEEFKSKIFEPFTQIDSSATREKEGTGLGLYITKQFVEQIGGSIGVESIEDSHTVFWFTLPLKTDQSVSGKTDRNTTGKLVQ